MGVPRAPPGYAYVVDTGSSGRCGNEPPYRHMSALVTVGAGAVTVDTGRSATLSTFPDAAMACLFCARRSCTRSALVNAAASADMIPDSTVNRRNVTTGRTEKHT
jgi:hypothetical protein